MRQQTSGLLVIGYELATKEILFRPASSSELLEDFEQMKMFHDALGPIKPAFIKSGIHSGNYYTTRSKLKATCHFKFDWENIDVADILNANPENLAIKTFQSILTNINRRRNINFKRRYQMSRG
jgi:hypothetical protein